MSSNWARIQQTTTAPPPVKAARNRQGRICTEIAFKQLAVVSHSLDYALSPTIVQAHGNSNPGRHAKQIANLRVVNRLHTLNVVAGDTQVFGIDQQRDRRV